MTELPVKFGSIQNPYKEFVMTIPAGAFTDPVRYNFDYFRLLDASGAGVEVQFGSSGETTTIVGPGIGYKMPYVIQEVRFGNTSDSPVTIRFALAIGDISDDRLAFTGAIKTSVGTNFGAATDVAVPDSTATVVLSSDTTRRTAIITNLSDSHSVRLKGGSGAVESGVIVYPNQTVFLDVTSVIYAYQESGSSVSLAVGDIGD